MQWNSDPKASWVAIYRLCVMGLLLIILLVLLDHGLSVDVLLSGFLHACGAGLSKP